MTFALPLSGRYSITHCLLTAGCILGAEPVIAENWQQSVSIPVSVEHDSNPTLSPNGKADLQRIRIAPDYKLSGTFGIDQISAGLSLQIERATDKAVNLPRQDPSINLNWRRSTETGEYGVSTRYQQASTRDSELIDSGLIVRDGTRRTQFLAANWRSSISEHGSLTVNGDRTSVAYSSTTLTDYINSSIALSYKHKLSDRIEPFLRLAMSHYAPQSGTGAASDDRTLTGGLQFKISETLEWVAEAGRRSVSSATSSDSGRWQGSFVLRHSGERHSAIIEASRSSGASGTGGFVESETLRGNLNYSIDTRVQAGLDASQRNAKGLLPNTMNQIGAWVSRELAPFWTARLNYQHKQRLQTGISAASSDFFGLSLIYNHPDL
jgi:hypothetical protein